MNGRHLTSLFRCCILVALVASSALLVHYLGPAESGFCAENSGCEQVRQNPLADYTKWLPHVGIIAFTALFFATLLEVTRPWAKWLAWGGGACAVGFLGWQALGIGSFCWLCVVVDCAAILAALLSVPWSRRATEEAFAPWAWVVLAVGSIAAPILWMPLGSNVPDRVRALYTPGKINVVEFVDFQCPYCREAHPVLKAVAQDYGDRVALRRVNMPLPSHKYAFHAAQAAVCADAQGKESAMADVLFSASLTVDAGKVAARSVGLDMTAFETCLEAPETLQRLAEDEELVQHSGFTGLPTTYIGQKKFVGVPSEAELRDAFEAATHEDTGIPGWVYVGFWLSFAACVLTFGRKSR